MTGRTAHACNWRCYPGYCIEPYGKQEQETAMPANNSYTVDITIQVREGLHPGPEEALADAIARLNLTDKSLIVATHVNKRTIGIRDSWPRTGRTA
jgi:hypothetical protein